MEKLAAVRTQIRLSGRVIPRMGGKIKEMAYAVLAAIAVLAAGFPGCSTTVHQSVRACIEAQIGGKIVCVRPGERCTARYERIYRTYAVTCKDGVLRERNYIGPATP